MFKRSSILVLSLSLITSNLIAPSAVTDTTTITTHASSFFNQDVPFFKPNKITSISKQSTSAQERFIFEDDFESGDGRQWITQGSSAIAISFANGKAHIKGSGAENRLSTKDTIKADDFTINLDLWKHEGNTNGSIKIGFKADPSALKNRFQVNINQNGSISIDKDGIVLKKVDQAALLPNPTIAPYKIKITALKDTITLFIDDIEKISYTGSDFANAPRGSFVIAGQFPQQDFSVDNIAITTTQELPSTKYTVAVNAYTDGMESETGGTITTDKSEALESEQVTLSVQAKRGYVFDKYTSVMIPSGSSTDGLLTITNNEFTMDPKHGSVLITAHFKTKVNDPTIYFEDDFSYEDLDPEYLLDPQRDVQIFEHKLLLNSGSLFLPAHPEWSSSYDIQLDANKLNATPGILQIAFMASDLDNRYVLELDGSTAAIKKYEKGLTQPDVLVQKDYLFNEIPRQIVIKKEGSKVTFLSNGEEVLTYTGLVSIEKGFGLINLTKEAPLVIDNIKISKKITKNKVSLNINNDGEIINDQLIATAYTYPNQASQGEMVEVRHVVKPGYTLISITFGDSSTVITPIDDTYSFPMPDHHTEVTVNITKAAPFREGKTFYVDATNGDDSNNGESQGAPWQTIEHINEQIFVPGDCILFKAGEEWNIQDSSSGLRIKGSGTKGEGNQITIGKYGSNNRLPRINGLGNIENVIQLNNQEYITIENLEISNLSSFFVTTFEQNKSNNTKTLLRAIQVYASDYGVVNSIHLKNLYIHDINGNNSNKWNGGIFFDITGTVDNLELYGIPTKYNDILIEGCSFERVDRSAIKLISSAWCNQSLANNPTIPLNWYPSTNVVVRCNYIEKIGGDGITVRDTNKALVEYNLTRDCRYQNTGYNVGIWAFQASNTVLQYNESYLTRGVNDGQGFDCDHASSNSIMQYNYSHDNEGGFMLIMNGYPNVGSTIRYNISQNDKDKTFEFSRGTPNGTMIYNNTIYSDSALTGRKGVFDMANSVAGTGNKDFYVFNNMFYYPENQAFYCGEINNLKGKIKLYNNAYYGGITVPPEESKALTQDPKLLAVGTGPSTNTGSKIPVAGKYLGNLLDGYQLEANSPLIQAGVSVEDIFQKYSGIMTDRSYMSPYELHQFAKESNEASINYALGTNFHQIEGVTYDKDFFGNPLSSTPDIGAATYQSK